MIESAITVGTLCHPRSALPPVRTTWFVRSAIGGRPSRPTGRAMIGKRNLVNEREVFGFLQKEGFERYELTRLSVKDQIRLFSSASFVIGPHGAGIGNIIFCQEGTKVLEIFDPGYVHPLMWMQVPSLKLQYGYVLGDGEKDLNRPFMERLYKPITVDMGKFRAVYYRLKELPW